MAWLYLYACIGAVLFVICGGPEFIRDEYAAWRRYMPAWVSVYLVMLGTILMVLLWPRFAWNCGRRFLEGGR